jgi:hypothetical protein
MSKEFQNGFKQGFALGTKIGHELGQQGCGSTDIEDILKNSISHLAAPQMVDPKTGAASSLGYVIDAAKITAEDKKKNQKIYGKYIAGSRCNNCILFQGKASDATGPCPIFTGKLVAGTGWCVTYAKKVPVSGK